MIITDDNYHTETEYISKSGLDLVNKSPEHYFQSKLNPENQIKTKKERNIDFFIGELFHCCLMEPHLLFEKYLVLPIKVDRRTKEGRATWYKYTNVSRGRIVVNRDIYDTAVAMCNSVLRHPIWFDLTFNASCWINESKYLFRNTRRK